MDAFRLYCQLQLTEPGDYDLTDEELKFIAELLEYGYVDFIEGNYVFRGR